MKRVSRESGAETNPQFIACIGSTNSLIVGMFKFNGIERTAVIDTGATGSFVSGNSDIVSKSAKSTLTNYISIKTADKRSLSTTQTIQATVAPTMRESKSINLKLYVIPERDEIMGHEVILGMDAIRDLELTIEKLNGSMIARVNTQVIAEEHRMLGAMQMQSTNCASSRRANELIHAKCNPFDKLVAEFLCIFAESIVTFIDTTPMTIQLATDFSTKAKPRPHSKEDILEIDRQITKLLDNDIIENSESTFSANVHLVPKKNGTRRMVVDYRFLNDISVKDHYPLPQINNMFRSLRDAEYFATLDCTDGFFQIPVDPADRYKTAFITEIGSYQYKRCPFGFTNSPAKFQRTMNDVFREGLYKKCVVYIDDILVFGKTVSELLANLRWVFTQCKSRTVKLKRTKCVINSKEVEFLGFKISKNKIAPVQGKYDPIGLTEPTKKEDIRAILGSFNHYSRFISNYADKTEPIRRLTRNDVKFEWSQSLTNIVNELKEDLNKATFETIADSMTPKFITIYISNISLEVTCYDINNNLVGRTGFVLKASEKNYTSTELQLLAVTHAYNKLGPFLKGPVTFRTTDKTLLPALKLVQRPERVTRLMLRLPPDAKFDVELVPGRTELENALSTDVCYDEVFYTDGACIRNGKSNCQASWAVLATINHKLSSSGLVDYLRMSNQIAEIFAILKACEIAQKERMTNILIVTDSKYAAGAIQKWIAAWKTNDWKDNRGKPVINQELLKKLSKYIDTLNISCLHVKGHATDLNNLRVDRMAKDVLDKSIKLGVIGLDSSIFSQENDGEIEQILSNLEADPILQQKYAVRHGELYYIDPNMPLDSRQRLFAPKSARNLLLRVAHDDPLYGGHLGIKKTKVKLLGYYWPKMSKDIENYIESCLICQQQKASKQPKHGLLQPIRTSKCFEQIHVDIVGPIHETPRNNRNVITAIDAYSRYGFAKPVPQAKATDVIKFLYDEIIRHHGPPKRIVSDNGPQFTSAEFKQFVARLGIKHHKTCEYHPQSNGMDERLNGTLTKIVKNYITPPTRTDWDLKIQPAVFVYNTTRHESIRVSPYTALYGFNPRSPLRSLESSQTDRNDQSENVDRHESIRKFIDISAEQARETQSKSYNLKRQPQNFSIFDVVKAKVHRSLPGESAKLLPNWEAPCVITKIIKSGSQPVAVELINLTNSKRRRSAFQDIRHLKERQPDESNYQQLPGEALINTNDSITVGNLPDNRPISFNTSDETTPTDFRLPNTLSETDDVTPSACYINQSIGTQDTGPNVSNNDSQPLSSIDTEGDTSAANRPSVERPLTPSINVRAKDTRRLIAPTFFESFDEIAFPMIDGNNNDTVSLDGYSKSVGQKSGSNKNDTVSGDTDNDDIPAEIDLGASAEVICGSTDESTPRIAARDIQSRKDRDVPHAPHHKQGQLMSPNYQFDGAVRYQQANSLTQSSSPANVCAPSPTITSQREMQRIECVETTPNLLINDQNNALMTRAVDIHSADSISHSEEQDSAGHNMNPTPPSATNSSNTVLETENSQQNQLISINQIPATSRRASQNGPDATANPQTPNLRSSQSSQNTDATGTSDWSARLRSRKHQNYKN